MQSWDSPAVWSSMLPSHCSQPVMPGAGCRTASFLLLPHPPMFSAFSPVWNLYFCLGGETKSLVNSILYQWLWGIPWGVSEEITPKQIIFTRRWWWYELLERLFRKGSRIKVMMSYLTAFLYLWWSMVASACPFFLIVGSWGEDTALCKFSVLLWRSLWEELILWRKTRGN